MANFTEGNNSGNWTMPVGSFVHPFSEIHVRVIFIVLYSLVFALCVFGNAMVLFAIIRSARLRSMTNFFLANLAVADFCVGVFCVLPNLSIFLSAKWILGMVMCKVYYFVWHMSYTASISILTVIAIERYVAIIHPLKARTLITPMKLKIAQAIIWLIAAGYNIPYLIIFDTVNIGEFVYCFLTLQTLDMKAMSAAELIVWYTVPLSLMTFMYTRISVTLWKTTTNETFRMRTKGTGNGKQNQTAASSSNKESTEKQPLNIIKIEKSEIKLIQNGNIKHMNQASTMSSSNTEKTEIYRDNAIVTNHDLSNDISASSGSGNLHLNEMQKTSSKPEQSDDIKCHVPFRYHGGYNTPRQGTRDNKSNFNNSKQQTNKNKKSNNNQGNSKTTVRGRKKVIRLLVAVVISFAICVLPHHIRLFFHYWNISKSPLGTELLSPISFIILYLNSALNPILYALFSDHFRKSFKESMACKTLTKKKKRNISFSQDSGNRYGHTMISHD